MNNINISDSDFEKSLSYESDFFSVYSIKYNGESFDQIQATHEKILLLPRDTGHVPIRKLYLNRQYDFITNSVVFSPIVYNIDEDQDNVLLDTVYRAISNELGIKTNDIISDDIIYLGQLKSTIDINCNIHCYSYDITNLATSPKGFIPTPQSTVLHKSVEPVSFKTILSGEINDPLVLASSMLLLSYFD